MPATASIPQYKNLVSEALWKRLVARLVRDHKVSPAKAEKIMDGALGFLKLCGDYPTSRFVPSRQVDKGWHTFLMYTHEYQEFCDRVCGRFIHHSPNDKGNDPTGKQHTTLNTVSFMKEHGIEFDRMLWARAHGNDCGDCCENCNCDND